jgi:DNA mismatch repair protein MutS2
MAGFERARGELARRVEEELGRARQENARLAQVSASRLLEEAELAAQAEPVLAQAREAEQELSRSVEPGQRARVRGLGAEGLVVSFDGDWAHMDMQGKRLRVRRSELEPVGPSGVRRQASGGPGSSFASRLTPPASRDAVAEVNVIGHRLEESIEAVERALDQALLSGAGRLRVIHGHGTGRLRDGLREHFRRHAAIEKLRPADRNEGGNGATILELR